MVSKRDRFSSLVAFLSFPPDVVLWSIGAGAVVICQQVSLNKYRAWKTYLLPLTKPSLLGL